MRCPDAASTTAAAARRIRRRLCCSLVRAARPVRRHYRPAAVAYTLFLHVVFSFQLLGANWQTYELTLPHPACSRVCRALATLVAQ